MRAYRALVGPLVVLAGLWVAACQPATGTGGSGNTGGTGSAVTLVAVDVGQGDCTLVLGTDGTVVLIDGGGLNKGDEVRAAVNAEAGGRVDHLVVTHYDADHLAGLADFLLGPDRVANTEDDGAPDAQLWDYGDDGTCGSQTCMRYRQARMGRGRVIEPGQVLGLGEASLECVAVNGRVSNGTTVAMPDENGRSVSFVLRHGSFSALLGGDMTGGGDLTADVETPVARLVGRVDLLKVNHHGSKTSSNGTALALWSPRAAFISVGTDNSYCHPNQAVLDRLEETGARIFSTGAGMVTQDGSCNPTRWPAGALQLGTLHIQAYPDGVLYVENEPLP